MNGWHGLGDAFVAVFFVEGAGYVEAGVGFEIEFFVASLSGAVFDGVHELVAVAVPFGAVGKVELLQLGAMFDAWKFCEADAADDVSAGVSGDVIGALFWSGVIKCAEMIELGIIIGGTGDIEMSGAQIGANDRGDGGIVGWRDGTDDEVVLIFHNVRSFLLFSFYYSVDTAASIVLFMTFRPVVKEGVGVHFVEAAFIDADGAFAVWADDFVALHFFLDVPFFDAVLVATKDFAVADLVVFPEFCFAGGAADGEHERLSPF